MKKLLFALMLLLTTPVFAQQTLTQINGWNAWVHLPSTYHNGSDAIYPVIIFYPGLGEVGLNANLAIANGPGAYITQGWDGNITHNGQLVEFIVISLQPSSAYPNEVALNNRLQIIKTTYRTGKIFLTGLSHGGWCSSTFVSGDAYGGPYTYASQIAAIVTVQGVKPDDNTPYPNLFDNFAKSGGKLICFEQRLDGRDGQTVVNRMNATVPGSAKFIETNFGGGGHCCWSQFYGGGGTNPGKLIAGKDMYEYMASIVVEGVVSLPPVIPTQSNPIANFSFNNNAITLKSTRLTYYYITDATGRVITSGNTKPGTNTIPIKNLASGFYVLKTYFKAYKIVKLP